jgi:hypothetical protein
MKLFMVQTRRKNILSNMLKFTELTGKQLFNIIMNENSKICDLQRQGWIFENICQILILLRCIPNIHYTGVYRGQLQNMKILTNIKSFLKGKINEGGNNIVDMIIKENNTLIVFSIKYKNKYCETDVSKITNTIVSQNITNNYKIGLFVKDKNVLIKHKYKNNMNIDKQILDTIYNNHLLFDTNDIIQALEIFTQRFSNTDYNDLINIINTEYLSSPREQLQLKLHQKMTVLKFINSIQENTNINHNWCISHKPRSGKSITILSISKYLLENGYNKILVMTSVPATIDSFTKDLEQYIDFGNIQYKTQDNFETITTEYKGIVFCSVQYLKINGEQKQKFLQTIGFDVIFIDESHQGSSTDKTKTNILEIQDIYQNIKLKIFASGTSDKTKQYYKIHPSFVYEWEIYDEAFMKQIINPITENKEEIIQYMVSRHGNIFKECLKNISLNQDYSKQPIQVLMKHSIPQLLIDEIVAYNSNHGTNYGYNCASLFALRQTNKGQYMEEFDICKTTDGIDIIKGFLDCIISTNRMRNNTIMKHIETTQTNRNSRKSTVENPLLFLVYLPTHTGNNTISLLQKTLVLFLQKYNLWNEYNIEYTNSIDDSGNVKETYNDFIETIMERTKQRQKKGCILLLGNKGCTGITYKDCDVTISLDDGHNLDNQKQRFSRALTERDGKTIGINVDMNIQRTYMYLIEIMQKYRKNIKTEMNQTEILYYLYEHNIFLFDPHQLNQGKLTTAEIMSYYQNETNHILQMIDDTPFLESIVCTDDMRDLIKINFQKTLKTPNGDLEGEQQECPKGDKTKHKIGSPEEKEDATEREKQKEIIETLINQTYEMCKNFMFPLLSLISKSYQIYDYKEIFTNEKTGELIFALLENKMYNGKKIEIKYKYNIISIMNQIIDNNIEIVNNIREIYNTAPSHKLRELIEKHFIPTNEEKKKNAEVSTPVKLVEEMLDTIPGEFWKTPHTVFEPCCGKGNFILGIFDRFFQGLQELYPDIGERCEKIMKECIHYADISYLNVFITTELLKCHIESNGGSHIGEFHSYVGDTLQIDINEKWGLKGFDAVVGNPPYNIPKDGPLKGGYGGRSLWDKFVVKAIEYWVKDNGYLIFVHPPSWRKPDHYLWNILSKKQILYLKTYSKKEGLKIFGCSTLVDYYILQNKPIHTKTIINAQDGKKYTIDLKTWNFLPSGVLDDIFKILGKNEVIYSRTLYGSDKKNISKNKSVNNNLPIIHSMTKKDGLGFVYSSENKGHFGIPKVILSFGEFQYPYNDWKGEYGMSQICFGLKINSKEEGDNIVKAINSDKFKEILKYTKWSTFQTDWRMFNHFNSDFWKEFI